MSIPVKCKCGKAFKAKDSMAGKAVRCPGCKKPLRIPEADEAAKIKKRILMAKAEREASGEEVTREEIDAESALLRFEEAQKKKQKTAEDEAQAATEKKKLIESYDQLMGKSGKKKVEKAKKGLIGGPYVKPTAKTKVADAAGVVGGLWFVKYIVIALLLVGGAVGSGFIIKKVMTYTTEQAGPQKSKNERIEDLFVEAEEHIDAGRISQAKTALDEILRLDPKKEMHRRFKALEQRLADAM